MILFYQVSDMTGYSIYSYICNYIRVIYVDFVIGNTSHVANYVHIFYFYGFSSCHLLKSGPKITSHLRSKIVCYCTVVSIVAKYSLSSKKNVSVTIVM